MQGKSSQSGVTPLWDPSRMTHEIATGAIGEYLDGAARQELLAVPDLGAAVAKALRQPKPVDIEMAVFKAVLAGQYYEVFGALGLPRELAVYEPCVGASNPVIVATAAYSAGRGSYVALNLNRRLAAQLRGKIAHLSLAMRIIESDAQEALAHLAAGSFDVACFHHAVNDILQTAVAEPHGMDTTEVDWFANERQMIEWLAEDAGQLAERGRPELLRIVGAAAQLVRPGGYLLFDHWNWCRFIGVEWFPWDLFYNLIPMTRRWIGESDLGLEEIRLPGVDGQWWMILKRDTSD